MKVLCIFGTKCSLKWIQAPLGFFFEEYTIYAFVHRKKIGVGFNLKQFELLALVLNC